MVCHGQGIVPHVLLARGAEKEGKKILIIDHSLQEESIKSELEANVAGRVRVTN